jgi:hypothetical protein
VPLRIGWPRARRWFIRLLHLDESAHRIALGAALGMFIALTPTVGVQMLLVFLVTAVIPANRAAGLPMVWVTNPATMVPVYSFNLWVGAKVVGTSETVQAKFAQALASLTSRDLPPWALVKEWWDVAVSVAVPLWVGSILVGLAAGLATYGVMYGLVTAFRRAHARRLEARACARAAGAAAGAAPGPGGQGGA